jgi:ribonuclease HII
VLYYEKKFKSRGYDVIIGVDEVGRGSLAGPVVSAAVNLRNLSFKNRIDDSKKLTPRQREKAFIEIIDKSVFGIGIVNAPVIDRLNILVATRLSMEEAVSALIDKLGTSKKRKIHVLIDGNVRLNIPHPFTTIIRGDSRSKSIACASILAKVIRDRIMCLYHRIYPRYGFVAHKGYGTEQHRSAIKKFGPSMIHRLTFCNV